MNMEQLTTKQAIAFHDSREWETWTDQEIAAFQIGQKKLCVPFSRFHAAMEVVLGRPVWTHEFAKADLLRDEMAGKIPKATLADVLGKIPEQLRDKTTIIVTE